MHIEQGDIYGKLIIIVLASNLKQRIVVGNRCSKLTPNYFRTNVMGDVRVDMAGFGSNSSGGKSQARC